MAFQSTLPVWGATSRYFPRPLGGTISIHAPRVGSDLRPLREGPARGISIHAPRVGSDQDHFLVVLLLCDFNPRSPCGERRTSNRGPAQGCGFQSTLPVWGATAPQPSGRMAGRISIHAPRVGSDVVAASL